MTTEIRGILSPVLTPIENSTVATQRIVDSVEFTRQCGCHGLIAAGTGVQETVSLTVSERKEIITKTVEASGDLPVLAGVSHPAQHVVNDLLAHATDVGADGVVVMPPWGLTPSDESIISYYESINDSITLPILVYNNPSVTLDLSPETMRRIALLDNVEYIKETSRNWKKLAWLIENIDNAGLSSVFGTMDVLLSVLETGGQGAVVPAPANVPAMTVYEAFNNGDDVSAIEAQRAFVDFPPAEVTTGLMPAVKTGAELSGVPVGPPRPPYQRVSEQGKDAIKQWLTRENVPSLR